MKIEHKNLIILILAIALAGGAGFAGGLKYQQHKLQTTFRTGMMRGNFPGEATRAGQTGTNGNRMMGFLPLGGEIIAADEKSLTIKLEDGSSKIVLLSDTTVYTLATKAVKSDAATGKQVTVSGTANPDGSVTATSVQIK